jgi:hypothetical protein
MAILCETFQSETEACAAADALRAAGVPEHDVGLLVGAKQYDLRVERAGGFAGPVAPAAPVGKYAGPPRKRWQAAGGFIASPDRQRQGSFADVTSNLIITHDRVGKHVRVAGDAAAKRILRDDNVPEDVARELVAELHEGHAVVVAEVAEIDPPSARALIARLAHAA